MRKIPSEGVSKSDVSIEKREKNTFLEKKNREKFGAKKIMPNFAPVSERHQRDQGC